jgi:transcriptional regulator with XRE-family HTH domain
MSNLVGAQEQTRHTNDFASGIYARVSTVAERLQEAMNDQGVDQSALARAIGVTQGTISLILLGKTRQSKYLPEIAIELGVSYDWLTGRDVDKHSDQPVDLLVTTDERDMLERRRALPFPERYALDQVTKGYLHGREALRHSIELPSEAALAEMYEAQLRALARLEGAELARALAKRLPRALARLQGVELYEETDDSPEETEGAPHQPTDRREPRRAQRT